MANKQRTEIHEKIKKYTPAEYQAEADILIESSDRLGISPRTLEKMFRLGRKHTDNNTWDMRNLRNLYFTGNDRDIIGESTTGHEYHFGPRFVNRNDKEGVKGQGMGWETGRKFNQTLKELGFQETVGLPNFNAQTAQEHDEIRRRKKDYLSTLNEALQDPNLIKDIQSVKERRKVRALVGLDEAIQEATDSVFSGIESYLSSNEFYTDNMRHIKSLILPKGGVVKRLKSRKDLPDSIKDDLKVFTNYKQWMTSEERDGYMTKFEAFDEETALIDIKGHTLRYVHDLQDLAGRKELRESPQALLKVLAQLQGEHPVEGADSIAAFVQLYDVNKERMDNYANIVMQSPEFQSDYDAGEATLRELFMDGVVWKGGKDDSIPIPISKSLEGIVKSRADPFLREAQRWFQNDYGSEDLENNVTTQSMRETKSETNAIVILERRKQAKERTPYRNVVKEDHHVNEDFEEQYGISLELLYDRMQDRTDIATDVTSDTKKKIELSIDDRIYEESMILDIDLADKHHGGNIKEIVKLKEWSEEDQNNYNTLQRIKNHPALADGTGLPYMFSEPKAYIQPEESTRLQGWEDLEDQLDDPKAWEGYETTLESFKRLQREHPKGYTLIHDNSTVGTGIEARKTYHKTNEQNIIYEEKNEHNRIVRFNPEEKDAIKKTVEELKEYTKLNHETIRRAKSLLTFKEEAHKFMKKEDIPHDTQTWGLFNSIKEKLDGIKIYKFQQQHLNHFYIDRKLADRINDTYEKALDII